MNFNKCFLGGRLTATPELKQTNSGKAVTSCTIAIDRKTGGEKVTDFINCVAFGSTAEMICKYLEKGKNVLFEGSWTQRKWQDKEGKTRVENECLVRDLTFVDSKSESVVSTKEPPKAPQGKFSMADVQPAAFVDDAGDLPF